MAENTYLLNGRFLHNLNGWTVSGPTVVYSAGDADDQYGVAVIPPGESIQQDFGVIGVRVFTLHLSVKPVGAPLSNNQARIIITDGDGNAVTTQSLVAATADAWAENTFLFGLGEGTTYNIEIENTSAAGNIKIDDVWLYFVPLTRLQMAQRIHAKLGRLASNLSTTPTGDMTEGSYTYSVDAGLRSVGAIDPDTGLPDVRYLDENSIQLALDFIERETLEGLQKDSAVEVDTRTGPYQQSLSQKREAITEMLGGGGGSGGDSGGSGGPVIMRPLKHE